MVVFDSLIRVISRRLLKYLAATCIGRITSALKYVVITKSEFTYINLSFIFISYIGGGRVVCTEVTIRSYTCIQVEKFGRLCKGIF